VQRTQREELMTFLLCDLCVLLRPVHFWLWLGRPGKSVVPFPALVPMAEPFRFTSGVSVSPREGTRLTETGPKARILQARRPPRAFFNGLLTELERLFGRGSTKRPSLTGLNGGGHRPPLQAFCRGFRLYWKEEERPRGRRPRHARRMCSTGRGIPPAGRRRGRQ
jgi:hypothetical protein